MFGVVLSASFISAKPMDQWQIDKLSACAGVKGVAGMERCRWWKAYIAKCGKPPDEECSKKVRLPQQEFAEVQDTILG